jgi:hypothetical protein
MIGTVVEGVRMQFRITIVGVVVFAAGAARAQVPEAQATFNEGVRLLEAGKVAEACDAFEASNKLEPRAGTLLRLGECRERNHQLASAWSAYNDALARAKDPKKRDEAAAKTRELEPKLSYLTVSVPNNSRIDGLALARNDKPLDPVLWNRAVPVDGGTYTIGGRAPGHEDWSTSVEVPTEGGKVTVVVPRFKEIAKPLEPARADRVDIAANPPTFTTKRKIAIGVASGGVVSLGVAIALGSLAKNKQTQAQQLCPDPQAPCNDATRATDLTVNGHSLAIGADVAFAVAGAAAIAGGVLWFTGGPERAHRVAIAPAGTGIVVVGSF